MQNEFDLAEMIELFNCKYNVLEYLSIKLQIAMTSAKHLQVLWKKQNESEES